MKNSELYTKTLRFSLMRVLCGFLGVVALVAATGIGSALGGIAGDDASVIGAIVGGIVGIIAFVVIARYAGFLFKAGQIAMIAEGVDTGSLPNDVYAAGKNAVKARFGTASAYFALMAIIKGITNQITNGINALTNMLGGAENNGNNPVAIVGGVISAVISIVLEYVNYCSLAWVFIHKEQSPFKSTCDGAVIYFQNWKTLLKNAGKILGITVLSLAVIGGAFFGLAYVVLNGMPPVATFMGELDSALEVDAGTSMLVLAGVVALLFWSTVHGAFISPYILVSVLRRYVEVGKENPPKVDLYGKLAGMSKSFKKALDKQSEGVGDPAVQAQRS